ncbi:MULTISPECIES: DCC1-like thiol-disulfide oxidoreductase family protein [Micrococcaceae]|uniref:DCC1-like thiol-disulfide oxidoreductase family protein n=1 Tax=unclassified Kocuria TaxID=2649579 RepID=UPI0010102871|nr:MULTISPECIES: DCC1-like thiol-disulfide oxidoreductase family protein [unclassified Kocuria]
MRTFVYDDDCGPCVPAARFLDARTRDRLDVVPFSRVQSELTDAEAERFLAEAVYLEGPDPSDSAFLPQGRKFWGHEAVGKAMLASAHGIDRLAGRIILAPGFSIPARWFYAWFSANRWRFGGNSCSIDGHTTSSRKRQ